MTYSFLEMAYDVLRTAERPLSYQEIWEVGKAAGLTEKIMTAGATPWQTLGSRLYVDIRDNPQSRFVKVGKRPARFFLAERSAQLPADMAIELDSEETTRPEKKAPYQERDLHPLLTYFVYANPAFNCGRPIYTKTIHHQKSQKSGYSEWTHPDMVGFGLPLEDWQPGVIELNRLLDNNCLRLFSFEVKKALSKSNYRESYFQAVSNSSWAHQGYLVAADMLEDDEFLSELQRLSTSFGIGIIHLNLADVDASSVVFPARERPNLDWETINKLCEQNRDFEKFLRDVKIDFQCMRVHKAEYDPVQDPTEYVAKKLRVRPE